MIPLSEMGESLLSIIHYVRTHVICNPLNLYYPQRFIVVNLLFFNNDTPISSN